MKGGEFYLSVCNKDVEALDIAARQAAFVKDYPSYEK